MNLTEHFSLEELTVTSSGLDNTPNDEQLKNLETLANDLDIVRAICGDKPIKISSGFRSKAVNDHVGGAHNSAHLDGLAADITIHGMTNDDICSALFHSNLDFDQIIDEDKNGVRWVHFSCAPAMRRQWLVFTNGSYVQRHG